MNSVTDCLVKNSEIDPYPLNVNETSRQRDSWLHQNQNKGILQMTVMPNSKIPEGHYESRIRTVS